MPLDMDSTFDRFKVPPKGGHFATTTFNESTFKKLVSVYLVILTYLQKIHHPAPIDKNELPIGRPLFKRELSKVVPPPDNYDIKRNIDIKPINPKQPCGFGHSFASYRRTCDIEQGIKVYDYAANMANAPVNLPNVNYAKKRNPVYSQGKAK